MQHYVCIGECEGVSEDGGATCQTADCSDYGKKLKDCSCGDGMHGTLLEEKSAE